MTAYYNEFDPFAAAWLRELIKAGHIAPGEVDTRSIEDVVPDDVKGFDQCHFFAGVGVWSYALRLAGWPDDRPIWTGSCPCQPFSAAGKGSGFADERHLWPAFHWLISQVRPVTVFGEQVASKDGLTWLDLVQSDMEGSGYAFGAVDSCSAGFGAPHIRQRLYWVGNSLNARLERHHRYGDGKRRREEPLGSVAEAGEPCGLADADGVGPLDDEQSSQGRETAAVAKCCSASGLADADCLRRQCFSQRAGGNGTRPNSKEQMLKLGADGNIGRPSPTNGFWREADWLLCRDGKWRPVEPGTFPLAHGATNRVGRLRGYGNAINAQQAAEVIKAVMYEANH